MNQNHPICSPVISRILAVLMAFGAVAIDWKIKTLLTSKIFVPSGPIDISPWFSLWLGIYPEALKSNHQFWASLALNIGMALLAVMLATWLFTTQDRRKIGAIGLVLGGVLGNLLERLCDGTITNVFYLHHGGYFDFLFNAGDAFIVVGVLILILGNLVPHPKCCVEMAA